MRRAGPDSGRGNNRDRAARKRWLLRTFDPELGGESCRCFVATCGDLLSYATVTVDRITPGSQGGRYVHGNIRPACLFHNSSRGDRDWEHLSRQPGYDPW